MKILIVEDDASIREIIKVYLASENYEIVEAENGKIALEMVDDSISLIILDIMMPEMNGIELCTRVREKYEMPMVTMILLHFVICLTISTQKIVAKRYVLSKKHRLNEGKWLVQELRMDTKRMSKALKSL